MSIDKNIDIAAWYDSSRGKLFCQFCGDDVLDLTPVAWSWLNRQKNTKDAKCNCCGKPLIRDPKPVRILK